MIDIERLKKLVESNLSRGPCSDGKCAHCQIRDILTEEHLVDFVAINIVNERLSDPFPMSLNEVATMVLEGMISGFCLGFDYKEAEQLDKLLG